MPPAEVTGVVIKEAASAAAATATKTATETGAGALATAAKEGVIQTATSAATEGEAKGIDTTGIKALLSQPDMTPQQGLEAFASGEARNATESQASPIPTPDNPLIINAPTSEGAVTVSGPKLEAAPTEATTQENPQQQNQTDRQDRSHGGRLSNLASALRAKFSGGNSSSPQLNTPYIDQLDLRRNVVNQQADTTESAVEVGQLPTAENASPANTSTKASSELHIPQIDKLDLTHVVQAKRTEELPNPPATEAPPAQPEDAAIASEDAAIKRAQELLGEANTEKTAAQKDAILDDKTLMPEQHDKAMQDGARNEPKNEQAKSRESERTMNQRERKVVETFAKLNPDFDSSDPETAKFLDEIAADENKMQLVEKAIDLVGKPNNLEDFLKLIQKPLQEEPADEQQTKEMHWLLRLLLEMGLAFAKIPVEEAKQVAQVDQK